MRDMSSRPIAVVARAAFLAAALAACSATAPASFSVDSPKLTTERATELARDAIEAFGRCNYAGWTADWSEALRAEVAEADFATYCRGYVAAHGSLAGVDPVERSEAETAGYVRWQVVARFGAGPVTFAFVIKADGELVEGYVIDPPH